LSRKLVDTEDFPIHRENWRKLEEIDHVQH